MVTDTHAVIVTLTDVAVAVDVRGMVLFSLEVWLSMGLIAGAAVLAILGVAASARREECRKHDLKTRVHELREAYQQRLAELRRGSGEDVIEDVELVPEELPEAA